jgi:hypothetical protein
MAKYEMTAERQQFEGDEPDEVFTQLIDSVCGPDYDDLDFPITLRYDGTVKEFTFKEYNTDGIEIEGIWYCRGDNSNALE